MRKKLIPGRTDPLCYETQLASVHALLLKGSRMQGTHLEAESTWQRSLEFWCATSPRWSVAVLYILYQVRLSRLTEFELKILKEPAIDLTPGMQMGSPFLLNP
eukprot:1150295-Pelagomonas_calceolata.AAC.9